MSEVHIDENHLKYQQKYRVQKTSLENHYGTTESQYLTLVSRLEYIKKNDPDSLILLKVFADTIPEEYESYRKDDTSQASSITGTTGSEKFCLRFGAIAVTPGTAVRRHRYNKENNYSVMKVNASMDACHLYGKSHGIMTDIVQPLENNSHVLDTFSVDSLNESQDAWNLSLSYDRVSLSRSSDIHSFCGDRQKGQDVVNSRIYPELNFTKCHFHIRENIKTEAGGTEEYRKYFKELCHSSCPNLREQMKKKYRRSNIPCKKVKDYFKDSLYPESGKWIVHTMPGEKEGLFTCQASERFHNVMKQLAIRECPIVYIPQLVIIREHNYINDLKRTFRKFMDSGYILPDFMHADIDEKLNRLPAQYSKVRTGAGGISGKVTNKLHKVQITHHINLRNFPPTCSNHCLRLYGKPCTEMCVYSKFVGQDIYSLLPQKYKVASQCLLLGLSLPDNNPVLYIDNAALSILLNPIILPPFTRTPRGRPHCRRLEKVHKIQRKVHTCHNCGLAGHHTTTCTNPTDGMGNYMDSSKQTKSIKEGYLVIPISTPSNTKFPHSLTEFHDMRRVSPYPSKLFDKEDRDEWIHRFNIDDNVPTHIMTENINDTVEHVLRNTTQTANPYKNNNVSTTNIGLECTGSSDDDSEMLGSDEYSIFSYPSDISHYTLYHRQHLSEDQKEEHNKWKQEKTTKENSIFFKTRLQHDNVNPSKERLNVGDIISYIDTNCVQGEIRNNIHTKSSTVIVIDPDQPDGHKIITSEGEATIQVISDSTVIYRSKICLNGKYQNHPGKQKRLRDFMLTKQVHRKDKINDFIDQIRTDEIEHSFSKSLKKIPQNIQIMVRNSISTGHNKRDTITQSTSKSTKKVVKHMSSASQHKAMSKNNNVSTTKTTSKITKTNASTPQKQVRSKLKLVRKQSSKSTTNNPTASKKQGQSKTKSRITKTNASTPQKQVRSKLKLVRKQSSKSTTNKPTASKKQGRSKLKLTKQTRVTRVVGNSTNNSSKKTTVVARSSKHKPK